ncbi:MAG: hypothetical protein GY765_01310 [bacterium]|nr:hypothetical protein [bacterium]
MGRPSTKWGSSGDIPIPADYDGNGSHDITIFRPSNGRWCTMGSPSIARGNGVGYSPCFTSQLVS